MKQTIITKAWPMLAGFLIASISMMCFELVNSYFFPLPQDLDWYDQEAVWNVTAALPWTAYILVVLGWGVGAFAGGCVTTYLSKETDYTLSALLGLILVTCGVIDIWMIGMSIVFSVIALPLLIFGTYWGHAYVKKVKGF